MNREIKFRGLGRDSDEWIIGSLVQSNGETLIFPEDAPDSYDNYIVKSETVGQFVGRRDRNGFDFFEGDIVKHHNNLPITKEEFWFPIYRISYDGLGFHLVRIGGGKSEGNSMFHFRHYAANFEIIGNVFDNPELINQ